MPVKYEYWDIEKTKMKWEVHTDEKGNYHRTNGPAWIEYRESGSLENAAYWINDIRHRTDGPASIWYREDGRVQRKDYYLNNVELTKEEWEEHPIVIAALIRKNVGV